MRQRAVIAVAVINKPELIIADEPTTALDVTVQAQILDTLRDVRDGTGGAIILITHDLGVIAGMVDRVQVLYAGTVVETGGVEEVFERPRMPYTVGLLGSNPNPNRGSLTPIQGAPPSLVRLPRGCAFSPRCPLAADECERSEPKLLAPEESEHFARCHRTQDLLALDHPQSLFSAAPESGQSDAEEASKS
jgi:peptide/nickel transport system ATP-binding protein